MKTFKVTASSISYYTLELEAETEEEAYFLAKDADGSDFTPDGEGDWVIVNVEEKPHAEGCPAVDGFGCRCGASKDDSYRAIDKMLEGKQHD
jgi:hypothetical protein